MKDFDSWVRQMLHDAKEHIAEMSTNPNLCRMLWAEFDAHPEMRPLIIAEIIKLSPVEISDMIH